MSNQSEDREHVSDPMPEPRGLRPWVFCLRAFFALCLVPLIFLAAAAAMMIDRDITAPSWITERIEARGAEIIEGATLDFGRITLRIGRDLHPTVRLVDMRLIDAGGLTLTRVPVVEGLISPRGVVFQRDVLMQEVRLIGAQINLRRAQDGALSLALTAGGNDIGQAPSLPELIDQFDQIFEQPALEALEQVRAEGVIVNFDDARAGRSWIVDGGRLSLDLRNDRTLIRGDFSLLSGGADVTQVGLTYSSPHGSRSAQVGLNFADAIAKDLASQSPALSWLREIDAPISAALRTELDDDGALGPLNATLEIGTGILQPNPATVPIAFDAAKAYFTYDPVRDLISFSEIDLQTEWGKLKASGDAYLRSFRDGLPRALLAQFALQDVAINPPGFFDAPPKVPHASVDLRLRFDPFRVEIGEMTIRDGDTRLYGSGEITATDAGWQMALDAEVNQIAPERLRDFWPQPLKPRTRQWVSNNLSDGMLYDMVAGLRVHPEKPADLALGWAFDDMSIKFLRHIPPIKQGRGTASLIDHALVVALEEGVVNAAEGGPLNLLGSSFEAVDLRLNPSPAILRLDVQSSVTAALSVLNEPPFTFMDKANLPVTVADGRAHTWGEVTWPLEPRPPQDEIRFAMTADLSRVRSATLLDGRDFAAPRLQVTTSRDGVNIAGPVRIGQVTALGAWDQRFGDPEAPGSRVFAEVDLSQDFLDEFGIVLPEGAVSGRGKGTLSVAFPPNAPPAYTLTSDLIGLAVGVPAVGWSKGPTTAGALRVEGTLGDVPTVDVLEISGGGLEARGRVLMNDDGTLQSAVFEQLQIGDWFDAPLTLRGGGAGAPLAVEVAGGSLDLRAARFGSGSNSYNAPVTLALDSLQITEGIALTGFRG